MNWVKENINWNLYKTWMLAKIYFKDIYTKFPVICMWMCWYEWVSNKWCGCLRIQMLITSLLPAPVSIILRKSFTNSFSTRTRCSIPFIIERVIIDFLLRRFFHFLTRLIANWIPQLLSRTPVAIKRFCSVCYL